MGIGEYFMSVIAASVITALVGVLIGDDKAAFGRIAGTVSALFLLCVIISPLSDVIARAKDELGTDGILESEISAISQEDAICAVIAEASGEGIEDFLREYLVKKAGVEVEDIEVTAEVVMTEGEVRLARVILRLYSSAKWSDPRLLRAAVAELTDADFIIVNGD